jgi:organic radical activating enzyme
MYNLVEIFESLQGEGRNVGRPCVFIRFAGCNLDCPWCDTDVKKHFEIPLEDLVKEVSGYRTRSVILTGGEPTIQNDMPELVAALKEAGFWIAVETNGTNDVSWLQFVDYIACSPKAEFPDSVQISKADEVRIVASRQDIASFCRKMKDSIEAKDYYISPCDRGDSIDYASAKSVLSELDGWSLSVQLHKILGFR